MDFVNKKAMEGTIEAHVSGNVPNIVINVDKLDARGVRTYNIFLRACVCNVRKYFRSESI